MAKKAYLIINQKSAILVDTQLTCQTLSSPDELPCAIASPVEIVINSSELDLSSHEIPPMSWLDRRQYVLSRAKYQNKSMLHGARLDSPLLTEMSCLITDDIRLWLEGVQSRQLHIKAVRPYIVLPKNTTKNDYVLVVTMNESEALRQTIFKGEMPIFTRTTSAHVEDILTTLTYIKNQYHADHVVIDSYLTTNIHDDLITATLNDVTVEVNQPDKHIHAEQVYAAQKYFPYHFETPEMLQSQQRLDRQNKAYYAVALFSLFLICCAAYQQYQFHNLADAAATLNRQRLAQLQSLDALPLSAMLPQEYLAQPEPLSLLRRIAQALPTELVVARMKWENRAGKSHCELACKITQSVEELSEATEIVYTFAEVLENELPDYEVQITSMPHQSAEHETYSGSSQTQPFALDSEANQAKIVLVSRK